MPPKRKANNKANVTKAAKATNVAKANTYRCNQCGHQGMWWQSEYCKQCRTPFSPKKCEDCGQPSFKRHPRCKECHRDHTLYGTFPRWVYLEALRKYENNRKANKKNTHK
jgi:RecJ-like exonuclease